MPRTWFLHEVDGLPDARERLLLKPLFSFAGGGIVFAPTDEQLAAIPRDERANYILQERITFEPVIDTPHGPTQAEIRMMYVWTDRLRPRPAARPHGPRQDDGRRSQQGPALGRRVGRTDRASRSDADA